MRPALSIPHPLASLAPRGELAGLPESSRSAAFVLNESARLAALREACILDTPPEQAFDDLIALAAATCDVPIALISLVDEHRQWFKARRGIEACETPRAVSFCDHAIRQPGMLLIEDATADIRFANNPAVTGAPGVRFYAGVPLVVARQPIGTLCVVDLHPRTLSSIQREALIALGRQVEDQLALRRTLRELRTAEAQRRELAEVILHDLKNPLSTIVPDAEFLLDEPLSEDGRGAAETIIASAQGMRRMLVDLLDVHTNDTGGLVPAREPVELGALLEGVVRGAARRCAQLGRTIELTAPIEGVVVSADPVLLHRVLENLLDNALKYARLEVFLDTHIADGAALISVRDDGAPVAPEHREALFEKSVRVARTHMRASRGLGLAFCRIAIEAHGGRLWVEDTAPAHPTGATAVAAPRPGNAFHIRLPVI